MQNKLIFLPLGGTGEIGMNLNLYGLGAQGQEEWIIVDIGVSFADASLPGIDLILPDPSFIVERKDRLRGIFLTHAHEDHMGAIGYLWPLLQAPVYATAFTAAMIGHKLRECGIDDQIKPDIVKPGMVIQAGPFAVEYLATQHSIPEGHHLLINTSLGKVFHSGDWKFDETPLIGAPVDGARLRALGDDGLCAAICDSTNAMQECSSGSESIVREHLRKIIADCPGRVVVTCFASNVVRLKSALIAAHDCDRKVVLAGRSMHRLFEIACQCGYLDEEAPILTERHAHKQDPDKILYLCTGSQGERKSALVRIAHRAHPHLFLEEGDTVIFSSKIIPGNERGIFDLYNLLSARNIQIINEQDPDIHVSGHPYRDEMRQMYAWLRPAMIIPVHGETMHLQAHCDLCQELDIPVPRNVSNGMMVELAPHPGQILGKVANGRRYIDGTILTTEKSLAVKMRRQIGESGLVVLVIALDEQGDLAADIEAIIEGLPERKAAPCPAQEEIRAHVEARIEALPRPQRRQEPLVTKAAREATRQFVRRHWGRKPVIRIQIIQI